VREFQERGAVHTHLLIADWQYLDLAEFRALAERHGFGRCNVKAVKVAGDREGIHNVGAYFAKSFAGYMVKGLSSDELREQALELLPPGSRLIIHSRNWLPGETLESFTDARKAAVKRKGPFAKYHKDKAVMDAAVTAFVRAFGTAQFDPDTGEVAYYTSSLSQRGGPEGWQDVARKLREDQRLVAAVVGEQDTLEIV
jgi:hypothetical protein